MIKLILRILRRFLLSISQLSLVLNTRYQLVKLFKGSDIVIVNGFKMLLDLRNDAGISRDLFLFKKREHLSTDYVIENDVFRKESDIIDIGANIGYYALLEAKAVGNNGTVYAIEPVSKNFKNLEINIGLNDIHNIKTFHMAIGDMNGVTEINIGEKGNFSSFLKNSNAVYEGKEEVKMTTLDEFVKKQSITPSLIRMDVEGYETKIIDGMRSVLSNYKPALLIEIHPGLIDRGELDDMFSILIENGYKETVVIKERKDVWMNRKGEVKPILKFLSKYIEGNGYTMGTGAVDRIDINELRKNTRLQSTAFHALIT